MTVGCEVTTTREPGKQEARSVVATSEIQSLADRIARAFRPQRIILFGSHAYGRADKDSDVDLMVILPYTGKSWEMATQIRNRLQPSFPLDLVVRSPDQVRERVAMGDPFLREIVRDGKVLYEADHR